MHVLLVTHYALPHQGGIEFVVDHLARRLVQRDCKVTVLTSAVGADAGSTSANWNLIRLPALNVLENYGIPFPIFNPIRLARVLNEVLGDVDVVHLHGVLYQDCVTAAWMAQRRGVPVVLTEHVGLVEYNSGVVNALERLAFETLGRFCCRHSDCVTVLNQRVEGEMRRLVRRNTPITTVYNGVDTERFQPAEPATRTALREKWGFSRPTVLFAGRLVEKKGIHLLAEAVTDGFDLAVCGRGTLSKDHPNIKLIGPVEQHTLVELYQAADLFALPSEGEGFPLAVQEALACGLPVIVTDNAVNREYLDESVARFVPRQAAAVRAAIQALIADEAQRSALSVAARDFACRRFDWDQTTMQYLALYAQCADG